MQAALDAFEVILMRLVGAVGCSLGSQKGCGSRISTRGLPMALGFLHGTVTDWIPRAQQ